MTRHKSFPTTMKLDTEGQTSFEESYQVLAELIRDLKTEMQTKTEEAYQVLGEFEKFRHLMNETHSQVFGRSGLDKKISRTLSEPEMKQQLVALAKRVEQQYEQWLVPPIPQELEEVIRLRDPAEWLPWEAEAIRKVDTWRQELTSKALPALQMREKALANIRPQCSQDLGARRGAQHGQKSGGDDVNWPSHPREGAAPGCNMAPHQELAAKASDWAQGGYDVAISFVREDADLARRIASCLQSKGVKVFHGSHDIQDLWGIDLAEHFAAVYWSARLCLIIISRSYSVSEWSEFETGLLARRARIDPAYALMLVRADDEPPPDILATYPTIDMRSLSVDALCAQVKARISSLPELGPSESRCRERKVVRVMSHEGGWAVKAQEAIRALRVFHTREEAVEFSESLRERDPCLEVVVHDSDGTVHARIPSRF